jgi:type VI secretion system protein ImpE
MTASELFQQGRLREATDAQLQEVKAHPADHGRRLFLFELAAFAGDLDRARRQIDAVSYEQPELQASVGNYRQCLDAEQARRRLFAEGLAPRFLMEAPEHARQRLEAVSRTREGRHAEAAALLEQANAGAEALKGTLNGKEFSGLRDADDLFGTVLEVFAKGEYFWAPLEQVVALAMNAPAFPRDLVWVPARLTMADGQEGEVFLPALYPGTHEAGDDQVKLGRATDWKQEGGGPVRGVGARTFLIGDDGAVLTEWRELLLHE